MRTKEEKLALKEQKGVRANEKQITLTITSGKQLLKLGVDAYGCNA